MFYHEVFYTHNNENFESDFVVVMYDERTPIMSFEMDYYETIQLMGDYKSHQPTLIDIVDFLQDDLGFENREPKKKVEQVLKQINSEGYYYKNEYVGGFYTDEKGRVRKRYIYDYDLTLIKADTKEEIIKFNCYNLSICETFITQLIKSDVMVYEDTEEYKLIKQQEEEEKERQEQERLKQEQEKVKAQEDGRLKEHYENLLKEKEQKHKEQLISLKLKEIEELQK